MNIKQMVFASYTEEDIEYRWIVYDDDNLDTPPLFSGGGDTEEEAMEKCQKEYERICRELGVDLV